MEGTDLGWNFFSFPMDVYDILLGYLPDAAVASLSTTGRDARSRSMDVMGHDLYWMNRLVDLLTPEDVPWTVEYDDIELREVSPEKIYKDLLRLTRSGDVYETLESMLLDRSTYVSQEDKLLTAALKMNLLGVIQYMTGYEFTTGVDYQKVFEHAVDCWLEETAVYLLNEFDTINPAYDDNYAVVHAAENDLQFLLGFLLDNSRVDPRARDDAALTGAANEDVKDMVQDAIRSKD